jgi:hypothetical protein
MHRVAGAPTRWQIILLDGSLVEVWADGVTGRSGDEDTRDYEFAVLMHLEPADEAGFKVLSRWPGGVLVAVASFPRAAVRSIQSR